LTISELDEILHLQHTRKVVLVSYPERGIQGVNYWLGALWDVPEGNKKAGRYLLAHWIFCLCAPPRPVSGIHMIYMPQMPGVGDECGLAIG
jgi:hypothetical protein